MTNKACEVIAKALEQFETDEFDSVAVVMISKTGKVHFGQSVHNRFELMDAFEIMKDEVAAPVIRSIRPNG